jgi:Ca-activated chloride channel family protein
MRQSKSGFGAARQRHRVRLCFLVVSFVFGNAFFANSALAQAPYQQGENRYLQGGGRFLQGDTRSSLVQGAVEDTGPVNILFLVDASYSMKEKFGSGERKMNAAKQVLESALTRIPGDVNIGLRVFGQTYMGAPQADCQQTALLVSLGSHNRNALIQAIRTIQPAGLTPLEFALRTCAEEDFSRVPGSKTIILISDGEESCGGDPCRFIRQLPSFGIKLKLDVVGLQLKNNRRAQEQLHCVAESSGGKYYDANSVDDLIDSVSRSVDKAISGKVIIKPKPPAPSSSN